MLLQLVGKVFGGCKGQTGCDDTLNSFTNQYGLGKAAWDSRWIIG